MGGFNIPPFLMCLTLLTAVGSAGLACLGAVLWALLPLPASIVLSVPLAHTFLVGVTVSVAASQPLQKRTTWLFGKRADGRIPWPRWLLMWPFHGAAEVVMVGYRALASEPLASKIDTGVYLSGCPRRSSHLPQGAPVALLDVTCEMTRTGLADSAAYKMLPSWETHGLPPELMEDGVQWALQQRAEGRSLVVYCTHGHSRSAIMVCALLIATGVSSSIEEARCKVLEARPGVHPNKRQWAALEQWYQRYHGSKAGAPAEP